MARAARIAALVLLVAGVPVAWAAAQTKGPTVVMTGGLLYHTEDVPPNSIRTFKVTCPPGYVSMSGTATDADGSTQLRSAPSGARSWTFSFGQPVTASRTAHVIVLVVCSKPRPFLPGIGKAAIKIKVKKVTSPAVVIPPGETEKTKLKCPAGAAPTGSGTTVSPPAETKSVHAHASAVLSNGLVARVTRDLPVHGGFRFTVRNPATATQTVRHSGRCLFRRASYRHGHRRRHRAHTRIVRLLFHETARPGSNLFERSCPRRTFPLGAGYEYASADDMIVFGHAVGRPRRVLTPLINGESSSNGFDYDPLCLHGRLRSLPAPPP